MENIVRRKPALNMHRCAFTGYRPQKMPFGFNESDPRCIDFKRRVKETIQTLYDMGYRHFTSGGALGMDMFAAEAVLELRAQHPDMMLEMAQPLRRSGGKMVARIARTGTTASSRRQTSSPPPATPTPGAPCSAETTIWRTTPTCCSPLDDIYYLKKEVLRLCP